MIQVGDRFEYRFNGRGVWVVTAVDAGGYVANLCREHDGKAAGGYLIRDLLNTEFFTPLPRETEPAKPKSIEPPRLQPACGTCKTPGEFPLRRFTPARILDRICDPCWLARERDVAWKMWPVIVGPAPQPPPMGPAAPTRDLALVGGWSRRGGR